MIKQSRKIEIILGLAKSEKRIKNLQAEEKAIQQWSEFLTHTESEFQISGCSAVNRLCGPSLILDILLTDLGYFKAIGSTNQPPLSYTN